MDMQLNIYEVLGENELCLGERIFPPLTGISYLLWLYVDKFSDYSFDAHPIRLLTIVRTVISNSTSANAKISQDEYIACLSIQISPVDKALVISTFESDTPGKARYIFI